LAQVFFVPNFECFSALRNIDRLAFLFFLAMKKDKEKRGGRKQTLSKDPEKRNIKYNYRIKIDTKSLISSNPIHHSSIKC